MFALQFFHFRFGLEVVDHRVVGENFSAAHHHVLLGLLGDVQFVGDHNDGDAAVIQSLEGVHDFVAGLGIEVARRFVSKDPGMDSSPTIGRWLPAAVAHRRVGWASDPLDPSDRRSPKLRLRVPTALFGGAAVAHKAWADRRCLEWKCAPAD